MRIDGEAELRMGCVCSGSERARAAFAEIEDRYQWADSDDCDVLVALGGDGFLLHVMHRHLELARPIFGMNRGTVGFLLNRFKAEGLVERIAAAHGGRAKVANCPEGGAAFTIIIPQHSHLMEQAA